MEPDGVEIFGDQRPQKANALWTLPVVLGVLTAFAVGIILAIGTAIWLFGYAIAWVLNSYGHPL